jgi:hypothetical protein
MTKLGHCTITVEPHMFEATMFAIKDTTPRPPIQQAQQPMYRPIIQYGPPGGVMPSVAPTPPPQKVTVAPHTSSQIPKSEDVHMANSGPPPLPAVTPSTPQTKASEHTPHSSSSQPAKTLPTPTTAPTAPNPPAATPAPANRGMDPVIQMLAERAATDPELKTLMRIVANGEASPAQLHKFQNHIDDLTRLQKARQAAAQASQPQPPSHASPAPSASTGTQVNGNTIRAAHPPSVGPPVRTAPMPTTSAIKTEYQQPQALRSKGPVPASKSDISGVVFEFTGGNGDRYLFPKFSILEYIPGSQVVASFLIVRKGSASDSPTYDPDLDYYQPITIRIYSGQVKQLDALSKVVAPQEEVQRYMNDIMDKATRAEYVLLAMRLPRDRDQNQTSEKEDEEKTEHVDPVIGWATTNSTPLAKVKPAKKVSTEEEQYKSFIKTVAAPV